LDYLILKTLLICNYFIKQTNAKIANDGHIAENRDQIITFAKEKQDSFLKRILIIDDDPDITLTFKHALERESDKLEVHTFNHPLLLLLQFKPSFYDLLLVDINMPDMNGFELCTEILKIDVNVKICFMSAGEVNHEAVRELYPTISIGCFIKKPVTIDYLLKRIMAELY
jgi:DNA-binding response OmpR family regulator